MESAIRKTAYLHRHLEPNPYIICVYNMAGEAAAPFAIAYGPATSKMKLAIAAEPRNRDSRFAAINAFAKDFSTYIDRHLEYTTETVYRRGGSKEVHTAKRVPQIIVPNSATLEYLRRLGRSLRYLGNGWGHDVPEATQWTGSHLTWLGEQAYVPGQSMLMAATQLLRQHYATGQSALEDENLATFLAWISNKPGSGLAAIRKAEEGPAFGPLPQPDWDVAVEPLTKKYIEAVKTGDDKTAKAIAVQVKALALPPLSAAFDATSEALSVLRQIPEAPSVAARWTADRVDWTRHCQRCDAGIPRFKRRHDRVQAIRNLGKWSHALDTVPLQEAYDDPLVMAELDATGHCVSGMVKKVEETRRIKPGNVRPTPTPVITIKTDGRTSLLPGTSVAWAANGKVIGAIDSVPAIGTDGLVKIAILKGDNRGTIVPGVGERVVFVDAIPTDIRPTWPSATSWVTDETPDPSSSAASGDGSPDLTVDQLLSLPPRGDVELESIPGVVQ